MHRIQSVGPQFDANDDTAYELGNFNPTGSDRDPLNPSLTAELNLFGLQMERACANKPSTVDAITMGDIFAYANQLTLRLLKAHNGKVVPTVVGDLFGEEVITAAGVSRIQYRFTVNGALSEMWTFNGHD